MKHNCISCHWAYKDKFGWKCGFPVPFYMKMRFDNQVHPILVEMMDCDAWKLRMTQEARQKGCSE
jgi:hypothetical protein